MNGLFYEVLQDGTLKGSFEKSKDGMSNAIQLVEEIAGVDEYDHLEIVCTKYVSNEIVDCELVQVFEEDSPENDLDTTCTTCNYTEERKSE